MDLTRHSTVGDVRFVVLCAISQFDVLIHVLLCLFRRRAEQLCHNKPGRCFVHGNGEVVGPDEATVEEVQLFQKKVHIVFDDTPE